MHARVCDWMSASARPPEADDLLRRELASLPPLEARPQLVHNDYRAANLVTKDSRIMAILDFDELAWDYCVSDLAHTGVYLGTLFHDWGSTPPHARQLLLNGYQTVLPLTETERDWFAFLTCWYSTCAGWPTEETRAPVSRTFSGTAPATDPACRTTGRRSKPAAASVVVDEPLKG